MRKRRGYYTLDQLLRLKRSERPSEAFWSVFDRDLHRKQRLLLQEQSVGDSELDAAPWSRTRKLATAFTAIAACWAVGFVALNLGKAPASEEVAGANSLASVLEQNATILHYRSDSTDFEEADAPFLEVTTPLEVIEQGVSSEPLLASARTENGSTRKPQYFVQASYTLELDTIMEPVNFEDAIAFNADESVTRTILEKYTHPLSDRGWKYDQYLANRSDPLNRISAAAFDLEVFDRETRRDRKLNKLTLKF